MVSSIGRYAEEAIALRLQAIAAAGGRLSTFQAKLFGGGNIVNTDWKGEAMDGGSRHITHGRELLAANKIPFLAEHVAVSGRRTLYLDLHSGHVWLAFPEGSNAYRRNSHG